MNAGADIHELNTVRKHLSTVQGGQLAKIAHPARVVGLVFSDVLGNDLSVVASGPFSRDTTSVSDAAAVLEKYDVMQVCQLPGCQLLETPKEDIYFANVSLFLAVDNTTALLAMRNEALVRGYEAEIVATDLSGEASEVGRALGQKRLAPRHALLYGGETTVHGTGVGGRSQELALGALPHLDEHTLVLAAASDGRDNTDAAGAIADAMAQGVAGAAGLDPAPFLAGHDSYEFWQRVGSQIITGPTGSNVSDLVIVLHA